MVHCVDIGYFKQPLIYVYPQVLQMPASCKGREGVTHMLFSKIWGGSLTEPRYIRRSRAYLQEARMAVLEHSIAAEHYQSSAEMYAARALRLEQEIHDWEEQAMRRHSAAKGLAPARMEPAAVVPAPMATPSVVRAA